MARYRPTRHPATTDKRYILPSPLPGKRRKITQRVDQNILLAAKGGRFEILGASKA